jgi:hypothetical protein
MTRAPDKKSKSESGEWQTVRRKPPQGEWSLRQKDWDSDVIEYSQVAQKLQSSTGVFKAVVLVDQEQLDVLKVLLESSQKAYGIAAIVPGPGEGLEKIPGEISGVLAFRKARVWKIWSAGIQAPAAKGSSSSTFKVTPKETVVLSVRVLERFLPASVWQEAKASPQRFVHRWLASRKMRAEDSWGWKVERTGTKGIESYKLFGLMRVLKDSMSAMLALSGDGLFVEATRHNPMEEHHITWVEKIDTESDEEYLSRARRLGSAMGVVIGRYQLGYRISGKSDKPLPRVWIAESLPRDWDADTVQSLLQNHFTDVHMLSQRRRRGDCDFFFRAAAKEDCDLVALPTEIDGSTLVFWARWAPPRRVQAQFKQVRPMARWDLRQDKAKDHVEIQASPKETTAQQDTKGRDLPAAKKVVLNVRSVPAGTVIETVAGDGSCWYNAFAGAMNFFHNQDLDPLMLRAEVITHMQKNQEHYSQVWCGEAPDGSRLWSQKEPAAMKQPAFSPPRRGQVSWKLRLWAVDTTSRLLWCQNVQIFALLRSTERGPNALCCGSLERILIF